LAFNSAEQEFVVTSDVKGMDAQQKAYLIGLICGKGFIYRNTQQVAIEFAHNNEYIEGIAHCGKCGYLATKSSSGDLKCKNQKCKSTVPAQSKTRYEQQLSTRESVKNVIAPYITKGTKVRTSVTGNKSITLLVIDFRFETELFTWVEKQFPSAQDYSGFRIPDWIWMLDYQASLEFFNGALDSTGYANAGSWAPRDGQNGTGRMRLYLQVVRNWGIVSDFDSFIRERLKKPVQTVDWGHPNIRDSKLQDYRASSQTSWAREHQIKFFPEYFDDCRFRIAHKQSLFNELLEHNKACLFSDDSGWFPPKIIRESQRKAKHPGEADHRLPKQVRRHFDAFWQINLALGSRSLEELALSAKSSEVFALTGDTELNMDPHLLSSKLEKKWLALANEIPATRAVSQNSNPTRKNTRDALEKETYAPLVDLLAAELRDEYEVEPYVFDTSSGNLNSFISRLEDSQLEHLDFCATFNIRPDVVGFVPGLREAFFIESKIELLNLKHLGQLIGYCAVATPMRALLVSTEPVSDSLTRTILSKPSVLDFSPGRSIEIGRFVDGRIEYCEFPS